MGKLPAQIVTPLGGMNQDDSLVAPAKDAAGKSLFMVGDYRYAANMRIGSSRSDHFGDGENIKSTVAITDYSRTSGLFTNPSFIGSLAPWQTIEVGAFNWGWLNDTAIINAASGDILYQPITADSQNVIVRYSYSASAVNFKLKLVYLDGTSVISTVEIDTRVGGSEIFNGTLYLTIPSNCNGIGIQSESDPGIAVLSMYAFQVYGFVNAVITGTEKVIGRYEDREFQRIYLAVWNSEGNHSLRYYDLKTNTVYELITWSGLNWAETDFVSMAKLDNWIALTERRNNPRLIDTDTIADLFFNLGADFREFHISFHKWSPINPPVPRVYYDGSVNNYEKLKNKIYQFATRINYKGNLKSRYSPISKGAITTICGNFYPGSPRAITSIEVDIAGIFLDVPGADVEYNYFGHDDIKFTQVVDSIDIVYREGGNELWKKWKTVSINNYARLHYFTGDANQTPIPVEDFIQPFDTVPFKAGTVEAIDNRFVFGDCLDEKEPAPTVVPTGVGFVTDPSADWNDSLPGSFPQFNPTPDLASRFKRLNSLSDFTFKYRAIIKIAIQYFADNGWRSAAYTDDSMTFLVDFTTKAGANRLIGLTFEIPESVKPPDWAVGYQIMRTNTLNINSFMYGIANRFIPLIDEALPSDASAQDIKTELNTLVNEHFENSRIVVGSQRDDQGSFDRRLQDYLSGNNLAFGINAALRSTTPVVSIANASRLYIDVTNWYNAAKETATKDRPLNKLFYNFRRGDRVRFLGATVANPGSADTKIYDVPILEFTGSGIVIEKPSELLWVSSTSSPSQNNYTIEVYTPQIPTDQNHTFFECGEWYPVLFPGTDKRDFSKRDWVYTDNTAVTVNSYGPFDIFHKIPLYYGDVYAINKITYRDAVIGGSPVVSGISQSMSPDPDTTFDLWDNNRNNGRAALAYQVLPVSTFKKTQVRFGGKIVDESFINNLNRMRDRDQFIYPSEYGRIRRLVNTSNAQVESVGAILLAIGENEAWSIYVNRTTLEDLSGRSQVALSDQVLGSFNTLLGSYGTMNPESVSLANGRVYWWDAVHGSWIRYGRDGLTPISDYKMRNWFREIGALLFGTYVTDTPAKVVCEFDEYNEELVTFMDHSSLPETFRGYSIYKGAQFSEDDKRWKSCHSYTPEMMGKIGTQLFLFKGGQVFKAEQGTDYNEFFGVKYDSYFEPVFNMDPAGTKVWQALGYSTTDKWSVERMLSEYRGTRSKQESRIPLGDFDIREDTFWAAIKSDVNSEGGLLNGQNMRSKAIQVLMKLNPQVTTLSLLHYVMVETSESPKNA